jgi:tRNA A37 N6-isopentenylltransferase MiaA
MCHLQLKSKRRVLSLQLTKAFTVLQAAIATGSASEQQLHQLIFDIATASRNLVKNQTTWFRDDELFR